MKKKKDTIPSGFEDILGNIYSNAEEGGGVTDIDALMETNTPFVEEEIKNEPPVEPEDGNKEPAHEDTTEVPKEIEQQINEGQTEPPFEEPVNEEPTNADVNEAQQVGLLFDAVGEQLGWNMADIDEKNRPLTVEQLTDFWARTIQENSVPEYADERIQALDEYVKNGGKFEDFYSVQKESLTLDSINLEDEANQKAVVRELLKHDGYTEDQINKRISRYEDADMLFEESEDALDRLKAIRKREAEYAAQQQEQIAQQQAAQQKEFFDTVTKDISSLTDIRGIAIPKEDRKALFHSILQ